MIKPASSLCNMRCKYCFYHDIASLREVRSYGVMEYNLIDDFLSRIHDELSDYDSLNIAFQGGEPSIAGLEW
ncbi:MAG: radical SAM/SPASM domain-containing protein, partial [Erysipelotrichaceae bacterium]